MCLVALVRATLPFCCDTSLHQPCSPLLLCLVALRLFAAVIVRGGRIVNVQGKSKQRLVTQGNQIHPTLETRRHWLAAQRS
jgi:hypothetical protein